MERSLVLYIAMSLDGYIAKQDDNIDFLTVVNTPNEDFGYQDFLQSVDTVIWGRRTFDKVLAFGIGIPHQDKVVYVVSKTRQGKEGHVTYVNDIIQLVNALKKEHGTNIYCDGGSEIVMELLKNKLFDRLIISIIPHLLGSGVKLFKNDGIEQHLKLKKSISYPSGLVQLWYDINQI